MGNFYFDKEEQRILTSLDYKTTMNNIWDFGIRMLGKYGFQESFDSIMDMDPDTLKDIQEMYWKAKELKSISESMADQMDQQTRILFTLEKQNRELLEKMNFLQEEIDSLKSKAKKND